MSSSSCFNAKYRYFLTCSFPSLNSSLDRRMIFSFLFLHWKKTYLFTKMHYRLVSWILKSSGTYSCKSGLSGITWLLYVSGLEDRNVLPENKTCRLCHSVHRGQNKTSTTVGEISRRAESGGDHPKHGRHGLFLTEQRGLYDVWLLGGPRRGDHRGNCHNVPV